MRIGLAILGILAGLLSSCGPQNGGSERQSQTVVVFAAASTKEAVEQVGQDFQKETGIPVEVSLGPSSGLAKQIEQGANADLFLSADLTIKELRDVADPKIRRLALAEPKVPAGEYARQPLRKSGVWDKVEDRIAGGIDVRATLQFVIRGEAEAGLVYRTDALGETRVRVALEIDPKLHEPIRYPLVLLRREPMKESARRFYDYLGSEKSAAVFQKAGFGVER